MKTKFRLHLDCDNAAFEDAPGEEIARILREAADRIESGDLPGGFTNLRDMNGNAVGAYRLREEQE